MTSIESQYKLEVHQGDRFEFGKNWARFLSNLTVAQIKLAESSLTNYLQVERLDGKTFLDIGSGSGLFSLAARRLGARVHSFDYDPQSVACTQELRRVFFPGDPDWIVERGSVLDKDYLGTLGTFDVVYSWGVLHHTGAMWQALENVKPLVPVGGQLHIAIYNDLDAITDKWARIKRRYNALPQPFRFLYALWVIGISEAKEFINHYRHGTTREWLRAWTAHPEITARGMTKWIAWIDWIGGYPYERASLEQIAEVYAKDGFRLTKIFDCSAGYGCNEFVFQRDALGGHYVDFELAGGRSMARRFGQRVVGPFQLTAEGWTGTLQDAPDNASGTTLHLIRGDELVGPAILLPDDRVIVAPASESAGAVNERPVYLIAGEERPLTPPFMRGRGHMWETYQHDLADLSDRLGDDRRSSVFIFEDGRQLPHPHCTHDDIAQHGGGRFSHWGASLHFSSTDGSDPNTHHRYSVLIVRPSQLASQFGRRLTGTPERTRAGWTMAVPDAETIPWDAPLHLVRNDKVVGRVTLDQSGRVVVAPLDEGDDAVRRARLSVVAGTRHALPGPFAHDRGLMWNKVLPELEPIADAAGHDRRSPLFVLENGRPLRYPHASHDEIAQHGGGRFSHWGSTLYFSSTDATDPNANGRSYELFDCSAGYGDAQTGNYVDFQLAGGRSMARRFGQRVTGPFRQTPEGWIGTLQDPPDVPAGAMLYLLRDDEVAGPAVLLGENRVVVAPGNESAGAVNERAAYAMAGELRPVPPPFANLRGKMWEMRLDDLTPLADREGDDKRSSVFVFEDGRQLPHPHSAHDDIDQHGGGRFSHWGGSIYFSSSDGTDPNVHHRYSVMIVRPSQIPPPFGVRLEGTPERTAAGWTMAAPEADAIRWDAPLHLVRNEKLMGWPALDQAGRVVVAPPTEKEAAVRRARISIVAGKRHALPGPFAHDRGLMWNKVLPRLEPISDGDDHGDRSPLFVLENGKHLRYPHAAHDDIARSGRGRFSHWGSTLYFSTTDDTDPNTNERTYELFDCGAGPGEAQARDWFDDQPVDDPSMAGRFGRRVIGPFRLTSDGWTGVIENASALAPDVPLQLLRGGEWVGPVTLLPDNRVVVAPESASVESLNEHVVCVVAAEHREIAPPFDNIRGRMWVARLDDLAHFADDVGEGNGSTLVVFEDGRQLPHAHAAHDDIDRLGGGRFSHWGVAVYFSSADGSDPNTSHRYSVLIAR